MSWSAWDTTHLQCTGTGSPLCPAHSGHQSPPSREALPSSDVPVGNQPFPSLTRILSRTQPPDHDACGFQVLLHVDKGMAFDEDMRFGHHHPCSQHSPPCDSRCISLFPRHFVLTHSSRPSASWKWGRGLKH